MHIKFCTQKSLGNGKLGRPRKRRKCIIKGGVGEVGYEIGTEPLDMFQ
jgi:hypothetical protein